MMKVSSSAIPLPRTPFNYIFVSRSKEKVTFYMGYVVLFTWFQFLPTTRICKKCIKVLVRVIKNTLLSLCWIFCKFVHRISIFGSFCENWIFDVMKISQQNAVENMNNFVKLQHKSRNLSISTESGNGKYNGFIFFFLLQYLSRIFCTTK